MVPNNSSLVASKAKAFFSSIKGYFSDYGKNIKHTYEHKIYFSIIEKELYGKRSIDSVTHDLDKMVLYILGFPKSVVSKFHKKHSVHHCESGKKLNLRSMLCDNIASAPDFKPEKKLPLREYYEKSPELQKIKGFRELLEKYNYGEGLNIAKIKRKKFSEDTQIKSFAQTLACLFAFFNF